MMISFMLSVVVAMVLAVNVDCRRVRVHAVSHSHDDVGWLKTPSQYYYGYNNSIQHANVRMTYDSVISSLSRDSRRRFTVVEVAFFSKWFREAGGDVQAQVRDLVRTGQIVFAGGGWVSHDEATPYFADMLRQTTLGHRYLAKEFGSRVSVQWQIDPFGHSAGQAMLFSQDAGISSIFVSRIDYQEFSFRQRRQEREFWWAPSPSRGSNAVLLMATLLHSTYCPPIDFNMDILLPEPTVPLPACLSEASGLSSNCSADPTNVLDSWLHRLVSLLSSDLAVTGGDDVLMTMGCDFTHMQAESWLANIDRIAAALTQPPSFLGPSGLTWDFFYSTPELYAAAVADRLSNGSLPPAVHTSDFLPYADGPHMFWSGYFTSRPALKRLVRASSSLLHALHVARATLVFDSSRGNGSSQNMAPPIQLQLLDEAVAQSQHHDAVSGTAKQHVTFDYAKSLATGATAAVASLAQFLNISSLYNAPEARNTSECAPCLSKVFSVLLLNPSSSSSSRLVRLPTTCSSPVLAAHGPNSSVVSSSTVSLFDVASSYGRQATALMAPFVTFVKIAADAMSALVLSVTCGDAMQSTGTSQAHDSGFGGVIENANVRIDFDSHQRVQRITNKRAKKSLQVMQEWCYYVGSTGDAESPQASGAYIFRPQSAVCHPLVSPDQAIPTRVIATSGPVIIVSQNITSWITQTLYVRDDSAEVEFELTVGPVDTEEDGLGKEVVMRLVANMTRSTFLTDSNGLEFVERRLNSRPSFPFRVTEPVAGNYYPVVAAAALVDADVDLQLTAVVDSTLGAASLVHGVMEMMVHRSLLVDDGRGVGEPLNETEHITPYTNCEWSKACGVHFGRKLITRRSISLLVEQPSNYSWRRRAHDVYAAPLLLFTNVTLSQQQVATWSDGRLVDASALPEEAEVVSLEVIDESGTIFVTIAHRASCNSFSSCLAGALAVDLQRLFCYRVISASRRLLTDQSTYEVPPASHFGSLPEELRRPSGTFVFPLATLMPMEIHAYRVRLNLAQ